MATLATIDQLTKELEANTNRASNVVTSVLNAAIAAAESASKAIDATLDAIQNAVSSWRSGILRISASFLTGGFLAPLSRLGALFSANLARALSGSGGLISGLSRGIYGAFSGAFSGAGGASLIPFNILKAGVESLFLTVSTGLQLAGTLVFTAARTAAAAAIPIISGAFSIGASLLSAAVQVATNTLLLPLRALSALGSGIAAVGRLAQSAYKTGMSIYKTLGQVANYMGVTVLQLLQAVHQTLAPLVPAILSGISAAMTTILPVAIAAVAALANVVMLTIAFVAKQLSNGILLAFKAGSFLFNSLLAPAFGAIKTVFAAGQGAYNVVAPILASAASTIAGWLKAGFAWLRGAFQAAGSWLIETVPKVASAIGSFVSNVASYAPTLISTFASIASRAWAFGAALVSLVGTLSLVAIAAKAIWESTKTALDFAKTANQLSATNGLSAGANGALLNRFSVFGIGAQAVQGAFGGNAAIQNLKAGAFGLPGVQSAGFLDGFADKYGKMMSQGFVGQLMATNMAKVLGLDNPEILALSKLSPAQRAGQQSYAAGINRSLGMNPASIVEQATAVSLSLNKITYAFEQIKMRLFAIAAPFVERVMAGIANLLGNNASRISGWMQQAVEWLFVQAPVKIADSLVTVTGTVNDAVSGLIRIADYLVNNIPMWFTKASEGIVKSLLWMMGVVDKFTTSVSEGILYLGDVAAYWSDQLTQFGPKVIQSIISFVREAGNTLFKWANSMALIVVDFSSNSHNGFRSAISSILGGIDTFINGMRSAAGVLAGLSAFLTQTFIQSSPIGIAWGLRNNYDVLQTPTAAAATAASRTTNTFGPSTLQTDFANYMAQNGPDWTKAANDFIVSNGQRRKDFNDWLDTAQANALDINSNISGRLLQFSKNAPGYATGVLSAGGAVGGALFNTAGYVQNNTQGFTDSVVGPVDAFKNFLQDRVAPPVQSLAEAAQGLKNSVGTIEQRQSEYMRIVAEESKKQTDLLRQAVESGDPNAINRAFGDALSTMLNQTARKAEREAFS